jgi:hypothetical protein
MPPPTNGKATEAASAAAKIAFLNRIIGISM